MKSMISIFLQKLQEKTSLMMRRKEATAVCAVSEGSSLQQNIKTEIVRLYCAEWCAYVLKMKCIDCC